MYDDLKELQKFKYKLLFNIACRKKINGQWYGVLLINEIIKAVMFKIQIWLLILQINLLVKEN